jgi:DNA polymerase-1
MSGNTLLVDGDVLVYRFANAEQVVVRWERDLYTMHAELGPAKAHVDSFIQRLLRLTECDEVMVVLSDAEDNFRKHFQRVEYKATRAGIVRPILWKPLRQWLLSEWDAKWEPRLEGDDMLSLTADEDCVIATIDKDLRQVPGRHYNWDKPDDGVVSVTAEEGERFFHEQILCGDRVDGYFGCPGMGPVTAGKLLDATDPADWWEAIVAAYEKKGLSEDVALDNARCARLLRDGDYNWDTQEIALWTPNSKEY